jgi:hypothetical protein
MAGVPNSRFLTECCASANDRSTAGASTLTATSPGVLNLPRGVSRRGASMAGPPVSVISEVLRGSSPTQPRDLPLSLGRTTLTRGEDDGGNETDLFGAAGIDVRYGLSSNISLNGTVNPDFGQVEADPAAPPPAYFASRCPKSESEEACPRCLHRKQWAQQPTDPIIPANPVPTTSPHTTASKRIPTSIGGHCASTWCCAGNTPRAVRYLSSGRTGIVT